MRINNLLKYLTFANILLSSGWGLVGPIFAIYVTRQVAGADLAIAGVATAVNMTIRSVFQLPFARYIDMKRGERDDFWVLAVGSLLISIVPLTYLWINQSWQIILTQGLLGLGWAMANPSWLAIFTRHIDENSEAEEWGFNNALAGIGVALTGALGGFVAEKWGFSMLFVATSLVSMASGFSLIFVYQDLIRAEKLKKAHHHHV